MSRTGSTLRDEQGTGILQIPLPANLDYVEPDHVHVMLDGQIAKSGGPGARREARGQG